MLKRKNLTAFAVALFITACAFFTYDAAASVSAESLLSANYNVLQTSDNSEQSEYYFSQLTTNEARGIYNALGKMLSDGKLETGTATVDLVETGVLENRAYSQSKLTADYIAARDAFVLDHAAVFYVDFSKMSIRQLQNGNDYKITLGIGRESDYFADGFDSGNVQTAITAFDGKAEEIRAKAAQQSSTAYKIAVVYEEVMKASFYALEADAKPGNADYVRNAYGTLVKGESVCEGFARAVKAVLDELGIQSVLVQGMYSDGENSQLHMWNYVRMEDYRWYLLDATMDNGRAEDGTSREFFLKSGRDEVSRSYQPDGVISLADPGLAFEFVYPSLAGIEYGTESRAFTFTEENNKTYVSYNGMGIDKAAEQGQYIVFAYDTESLNTWYYVSLHYAAMNKSVGNGSYSLADIDEDTRFVNYNGSVACVYAVTDTAPEIAFENVRTFEDAKYVGDSDGIYDVSAINGTPTEMTKRAPYAVTKTPNNARLEENKTYTATITYSENLKKANAGDEAGIELTTAVAGATVTDFVWSESKPNTVSFTFTTKSSYNYSVSYYFTLTNLVGAVSRLAPQETAFTVVNNPEFSCPKVEGSLNTVYAGVPALIADGDLSLEGWKDDDGNDVASDLPSRLSLVATYPTESQTEDMLDKIEESGTVPLASSTYNLKLELCSNQISYVSGKKIKVLLPYPEGFDASRKVVTFKAYHFKADGTPEEIECIVTENGIIMLCDSFSPFAIVAAEGETAERKVLTNVIGNGSADRELITLKEGESGKVTVTAQEGFTVEAVTLNGKAYEVNNGEIELNYSDLRDGGNILEVSVADAEVTAAEKDAGYSLVTEDISVTENDGAWWIWLIVGLVSAAVPRSFRTKQQGSKLQSVPL